MSTELMTSKKQRGRKTNPIIQAILDEYQPKTTEDVQEAIKDIFAPMLEAMLQGEMNHHLGYEANEHGCKNLDNRRNGYSQKI